MKKQINPTVKAYLIRSAFYLLLLLAVCAIPFALAQSRNRGTAKQSTQFQKASGQSQPLAPGAVEGVEDKSAPMSAPVRMMSDAVLPGPYRLPGFEYAKLVPRSLLPGGVIGNALINNNAGSTGTSDFTQSETSVVSFGSTIVVGFNDSGSFTTSSNQFTGWSRSTDSGGSWTDGGLLPASAGGDAGDPVLARDSTTGRIYFATLGFTSSNFIQVFRSTDNGATWLAPINAAPGKTGMQDKEWITVDNFVGSGNGNVYLVERDFGAGNGIYLFRSTDGGGTFGPSGGTAIVSSNQGAFVTVSPDHSVNAYWWDGLGIRVRKSTDQGVTFGATFTVTTFVDVGGSNGDLGLTGTVNGGSSAAFRSSKFPHLAVNPVSGNIYCAYNDKITSGSSDKCDIFFVQSTDGGATWSARTKVNDDATTTDQWTPQVVVSPTGDRIGFFYYSRQENPAGNNLFKYYDRLSAISGATITFSPSVAVSDTASLPEFGRDAVVNSTYMGDYDQAYGQGNFFDIVWSDNRSDLPSGAPRKDPNVYFQSIPVSPCNSYTTDITETSIIAGTTDTGNHCDDCLTTITFPFPVSVYGQTFTGADVSSNGALELVNNNTFFSHDYLSLPNADWDMTIFPYQNDLRTDNGP